VQPTRPMDSIFYPFIKRYMALKKLSWAWLETISTLNLYLCISTLMLVFSIQCKNVIKSSKKQNSRNNNPIKISNWFKRPIVIRKGINQKEVEKMKNENRDTQDWSADIFVLEYYFWFFIILSCGENHAKWYREPSPLFRRSFKTRRKSSCLRLFHFVLCSFDL